MRDQDDRASDVWVAIIELQENCTCDTTDVTQCPNYMPGDELPVEGDDDGTG